MLLSIGMIVKNEEKYLEKCLKALEPILENVDSELIIVDTGSTDKTMEIAGKYTEKLYCHQWNDNFAEMRNKVLSYCKGQWFFSIDADEIVYNTDNIISFFNSGEYLAYNTATVDIKNYTHSNDKTRFTIGSLTRLFKKGSDFEYIGKIHEQPLVKLPIKKIDCILEHYGYISDDDELIERKFNRNKKLLESELLKNPDTIYLRYQLAVNYGLHKEYKKALKKFEELYISMDHNQKIICKYVLTEYAQLLLTLKKYKKCEEICEKELNLVTEEQPYKIDLTYYMAKSQLMLNQYNECIISYKRYLDLVEKNEKLQLDVDPTITIYTLMMKDDAYKEMLLANFELENYAEVLKCADKIEKDETMVQISNVIIKSYIALDDIDGLYDFYKNIKLRKSELLSEKFQIDLENEKLNLPKDKCISIEKEFCGNEDIYEEYNYLMLNINEDCNLDHIADLLIEKNIDKAPAFYGIIIYALMKQGYNLINFCAHMSYDTIVRFLEFCNKKYGKKLFSNINKYFNSIDGNGSFDELRVKIVFFRVLLILDDKNECYMEVFNQYVKYGIEFIGLLYSKYVLENNRILEMKNSEHEFFMYMMMTEKSKNDELSYIRYLRKALDAYPCMKKGIEELLNDVKKSDNYKVLNNMRSYNKEFIKLKKQLIDNIKILMKCDKSREAESIINQYEAAFGSDNDILLIKSELALKNIKQIIE